MDRPGSDGPVSAGRPWRRAGARLTGAFVAVWVASGLVGVSTAAWGQARPAPLAAASAAASAAGPAPAPTAASGPGAAAGRAEGTPSLAQELEQTQAALARVQSRGDAAAPDLVVEEQRNLLTRLVALLRDRLQRAGAPAAANLPAVRLPPGLAGSPPFAVADLDALRDQREGLASQRDALAVSLQALDDELTDRAAARRKAEEAVRLAQERAERARDLDELVRLRAQLDLERLRERVATLELARVDTERTAGRVRLQALSQRLGEFDTEIDRVRRHQVLDEPALAAVALAADAARDRLAAERRALEARIARVEASTDGPPETAGREAAALRGAVQALSTLEQVHAGRAEAWRLRRLALEAATEAQRRRTAETLLRRSIDQLALRDRGVSERLNYLRLALRTQRLKVEALGQDSATPAAPSASPQATPPSAEARVLQAMTEEVEAHERLQEETRRLQRLLQRSLDDLTPDAGSGDASHDWATLGERLRAAFLAVWRYELFSASETLQVDGRQVTLDYGVTVGKSLGVVLLFALGYFLAGRLSRLLVDMAVRRAKLSPQLGAVLHRWVMTTLVVAVLLVVLKLARIPLTAFAFLGGALAIGIGFGTQNIIKNLISGIIILFERKVRVGDVVTIDGVDGTVTAVDLRATTVNGFDGIDCIVPNSRLLENQVSNWSHGNPVVRRGIRLRLAWGEDAREGARRMLDCAREDPSVLASPAPQVLFEDFGADAQVLLLQYWIRLGGPRSGPLVDSELRHAIAAAFDEAGLRFAAPRLEVRMPTPPSKDVPAWTPAPVPAAVRGVPGE